MSLIASITFVVGLFAALGVFAWTVMSISLAISSDPASSPSPSPSTVEVVEDSRELVGQHAG